MEERCLACGGFAPPFTKDACIAFPNGNYQFHTFARGGGRLCGVCWARALRTIAKLAEGKGECVST